VARRFTVGASLRRFDEVETGVAEIGYGGELGFLALRNLWLVGGYNVAGIDDDALSGDDPLERGPFVSVRFKFDENSLSRLSDPRLDRD
jgi:hypothetical protein